MASAGRPSQVQRAAEQRAGAGGQPTQDGHAANVEALILAAQRVVAGTVELGLVALAGGADGQRVGLPLEPLPLAPQHARL